MCQESELEDEERRERDGLTGECSRDTQQWRLVRRRLPPRAAFEWWTDHPDGIWCPAECLLENNNKEYTIVREYVLSYAESHRNALDPIFETASWTRRRHHWSNCCRVSPAWTQTVRSGSECHLEQQRGGGTVT